MPDSIPADIVATIDLLHAAVRRVAQGDVGPIKALYSHAADATSFYGWGGYEKGWNAVSKRWDWAGQQFKGGTVAYQNVTTVVTADMFYVTDIETFDMQGMAGLDGPTGWSNRVTHIFRREAGAWRLVHRHGNRLETQFEPGGRMAQRAAAAKS